MPIFYHYTDEEGAIKASLKHMTRGDTAYGNGVYMTSLNPWTSSKDEIMINNWGNNGTTEMQKIKRVFILSIPETDIKEAEDTIRDIYLFGHGKDLRLHKYPWVLKCSSTDRIIASYKYKVVSQRCPFAIGLDRYDDYLGDYVMSDDIVNGSPVYESSTKCLFMGSDGDWYLGLDVKTPMISQDSYSRLGPNETGKWKSQSSDGLSTDSLLGIHPCSLATKPSDCYLSDLYKQLTDLVDSKPGEKLDAKEDKAEDPNAQPTVWVSGWVDYRDKYGFGYALNNDSIGVVFKDFTKILLLADEVNILYISDRGEVQHYTVKTVPSSLEKKMELLKRFRNSAKENLSKTCSNTTLQHVFKHFNTYSNTDMQEEYELSRIPALKSWTRTPRATVLHLTNGTLQINFKDNTKALLCPLQRAVTYIDEGKKKRTFRFDLLNKYGCSPELSSMIRFAQEMTVVMPLQEDFRKQRD